MIDLISNRILRPTARAIVSRVPVPWQLVPWVLKRPLADYDFAIDFFNQHDGGNVEGDVLELGCFLGFGTAKLAASAQTHGKTVHTADYFGVDFGKPEMVTSVSGRRYLKLYHGQTQREVFDQITRKYSNIEVYAGDITKLEFPESQRFAFSFIDAAHEYEEVEYYLKLSWSHMTPGGVLALNDYLNPETPEVTQAADDFVSKSQDMIAATGLKEERRMIAFVKSNTASA